MSVELKTFEFNTKKWDSVKVATNSGDGHIFDVFRIIQGDEMIDIIKAHNSDCSQLWVDSSPGSDCSLGEATFSMSSAYALSDLDETVLDVQMTATGSADSTGTLEFTFFAADDSVLATHSIAEFSDEWAGNRRMLELRTFSFLHIPAWDRVQIKTDSTNGIQFDVFRFRVMNKRIDLVEQLGCSSIWIDKSPTATSSYECYEETAFEEKTVYFNTAKTAESNNGRIRFQTQLLASSASNTANSLAFDIYDVNLVKSQTITLTEWAENSQELKTFELIPKANDWKSLWAKFGGADGAGFSIFRFDMCGRKMDFVDAECAEFWIDVKDASYAGKCYENSTWAESNIINFIPNGGYSYGGNCQTWSTMKPPKPTVITPVTPETAGASRLSKPVIVTDQCQEVPLSKWNIVSEVAAGGSGSEKWEDSRMELKLDGLGSKLKIKDNSYVVMRWKSGFDHSSRITIQPNDPAGGSVHGCLDCENAPYGWADANTFFTELSESLSESDFDLNFKLEGLQESDKFTCKDKKDPQMSQSASLSFANFFMRRFVAPRMSVRNEDLEQTGTLCGVESVFICNGGERATPPDEIFLGALKFWNHYRDEENGLYCSFSLTTYDGHCGDGRMWQMNYYNAASTGLGMIIETIQVEMGILTREEGAQRALLVRNCFMPKLFSSIFRL